MDVHLRVPGLAGFTPAPTKRPYPLFGGGEMFAARAKTNPANPQTRQLVGSVQLLQQRLGLLEVSGLKALREPAVDGRQQLSGFSVLALALPQAAQAQRGPQLSGPGLLT